MAAADDDDPLAASTAAANPPQPGPSPKRRRRARKCAAPTTESELVSRRQQARDAVDALKAELRSAAAKEISIMTAMEGMDECVLCQNEAKSITMTPCGHAAICDACAYTENTCPICLEPIDGDRTVAV